MFNLVRGPLIGRNPKKGGIALEERNGFIYQQEELQK
jgi:hypothetical protein